jgi:DegV family protein with EDD domain
MKKISLIIGETSSLPKEIVEKYRMVVVPYIVNWPDGEKIPGENIFQKMRRAEEMGIKSFPKTSQPPPGVFKKIFEEELKRAEKLLVLTLSSKLSGGYNSALQAREMVSEKERIFVLDTLNVTIGEGLIDLYVAKMIEKGKDGKEILKEFPEIVKNTHLFGMVENPKWLERGGRISHSFAVLLEKMQKIGMRPLIGIKNGKVKPVALKMRAKDVPEALFRELKKEIEKFKEKNEVKVAIGHADNLEGVKKLKQLIEENLKNVEILFLGLIDPIIGVHVGPGTLAIAWFQFKL